MVEPTSITFVVPGQPVAQPRPQITTRGGIGRAFVKASHPIHAYRQAVGLVARASGVSVHTGQVTVEMEFVFARAASHWTKGGLLAKGAPPWLGKPDGDNLQKGVLDALIGIAYPDDSHVGRWGGSKRYAERDEPARTIITVTRL